MNNKIGSYNLYVVNVRFHLNVFSTQVRVSPYIPKWGRDKILKSLKKNEKYILLFKTSY